MRPTLWMSGGKLCAPAAHLRRRVEQCSEMTSPLATLSRLPGSSVFAKTLAWSIAGGSILLAVTPATSAAASTRTPRLSHLHTESVQVGSLHRTFTVFTPTKVPIPAAPAPVIIALSAYTHTASDLAGATALNPAADKANAIVIYPDAVGLKWNAGNCCALSADPAKPPPDDIAFLDAVIAQVRAKYPTDLTRLDVLGFSNGAMLAQRYACERATEVAAVASVAGTLEAACSPSRPVSLLSVNGARDTTVPYLGTPYSSTLFGPLTPVPTAVGFWEATDRCSGLPQLTVTPGALMRSYPTCRASTTVQMVTLPNTGHVWPTLIADRYDATAAALSFFAAHPRRPTTIEREAKKISLSASKLGAASGSHVVGTLLGRFDWVAGVPVTMWARTGTTWTNLGQVITDVAGSFDTPAPSGYSELWFTASISGATPASAHLTL